MLKVLLLDFGSDSCQFPYLTLTTAENLTKSGPIHVLQHNSTTQNTMLARLIRPSLAAARLPVMQAATFVINTRKPAEVQIYERHPRRLGTENALTHVTEKLMKQFDPQGVKKELMNPKSAGRIKPGDIVQIKTTDGTLFTGLAMVVDYRGLSSNLLLRSKITKIGIDRRFKIFAPTVDSVKIIRRATQKYTSERLYYIRGHKRLDVGDLEASVKKAAAKRKKFLFK